MKTIISTEVLAQHLKDPNWVIIDCRFELMDPAWGFEEYQSFHIPGAIYANLDKDLSAPKTPQTGRHPLPDPEKFLRKIAEWGITPEKQVVVYDTAAGAFAARLWWMLRLYDLTTVAVLDGGIGAWLAEKRETNSGIETAKASAPLLKLTYDANMIASADQVEQIRQDPGFLLLDARSPIRYRGEEEPIDPVAGRIPGAVNRFHTENLTRDGVLKPAEVLQIEFSELLGNIPPSNVVVYCGSGVTSCFHLLAMEHIGLTGARLYAGSWSEWIRDPSRPRTKD
jgi:thiosulfate/3-mercaptopyruvate sulfurtransferase